MTATGKKEPPGTAPEREIGRRPRVAMLGTGTMGSAMAANLLLAGLRVDGWSRTKECAAPLTEAGATAHPSPDQAVAHADVVITMLPDAAAVTSVASARAWSRRSQAARYGPRWAPSACGPPSSWRTSWLTSARTCGSSTHRSQGPAGLPRLASCSSWRRVRRPRNIDAADDAPDFSLRWALKDVDLALGAAKDRTLPVTDAISCRWHELVETGLGEADVSAVRHGLARAMAG
jgi:3-hydroxyisobutyrate dehydrogenase-like beta-hydroxyacid dehydrogenase